LPAMAPLEESKTPYSMKKSLSARILSSAPEAVNRPAASCNDRRA
jgi:hypothetical protein